MLERLFTVWTVTVNVLVCRIPKEDTLNEEIVQSSTQGMVPGGEVGDLMGYIHCLVDIVDGNNLHPVSGTITSFGDL